MRSSPPTRPGSAASATTSDPIPPGSRPPAGRGLVRLLALGAVLGGWGCVATGAAGAPSGPAPDAPSGTGIPASSATGLDATLWMQQGAGYRAAALQAYRLAEEAMRRALEDGSRTAALEQEGRPVADLAPAVVLDVDETVLDNSPYEARRIRAGAGFTPESWAAWVREAAAAPVPGALSFTRTAERLGVEVFYVTNRDHELEAATRRNLRRLGFPLDTTSDHLLTEGEREGWGSDKTSRRAAVARDHRVLVLLGDDLNDFVDARGSVEAYRRARDEHLERFGTSWFMLPNPSYGSWERAATGFSSGLSPEETLRRKVRSLETAEGSTASGAEPAVGSAPRRPGAERPARREARAGEDRLQAGPMVGYSTMREVLLWVQTDGPARVHFVYYDSLRPERRYSTDTLRTREDSAFVARLVADSVQPGRAYGYELYLDGRRVERPYSLRFQSQELWQWRRDPPPFRMALGSCAYVNEPRYDRPGEPYGAGYGIFRAIHQKRPDAMLWLGDNTYLREADWNSRTGILHRYTHTRSLPELQPLLGSVHHYAIWDDHDYGPNNSDRSYWEKETTLEAFRLFWGNPCYGAAGLEGIACTFRWSDVRFFLLDDRWYRSPNRRVGGPHDLLGQEQLRWLVDALASSRATFNVIALGGQVLSSQQEYEGYASFPAERRELLEHLRREEVPGVVFLSGDRHFTEMSVMERPGTYPLHEFTVSPLTAGPYEEGREEENVRRVEGTVVTERNFAIMEVTGPRTDRTMTITVYDGEGREAWTRSLRARDLR